MTTIKSLNELKPTHDMLAHELGNKIFEKLYLGFEIQAGSHNYKGKHYKARCKAFRQPRRKDVIAAVSMLPRPVQPLVKKTPGFKVSLALSRR